jgi:PPOX class probable F420-dependent enzyme
MAKMTADQSDAFLRETRIAKLATLDADGAPTVVPVWFDWDGVTATVFTSRGSAKIARIERDPRVALSVEEPVGVPEKWVTVEGTATIEQSGGIELARRLARRYYTPERAASALESWEKVADDWVVLRITPRRIRSST